MRRGQQLRITEHEGSTMTVESEGVLRTFDVEPADAGHRGHGGLDAGQMLTVREDVDDVHQPVLVDVWGCGCQFTLVPKPPV
jgi:hypothetical protein